MSANESMLQENQELSFNSFQTPLEASAASKSFWTQDFHQLGKSNFSAKSYSEKVRLAWHLLDWKPYEKLQGKLKLAKTSWSKHS